MSCDYRVNYVHYMTCDHIITTTQRHPGSRCPEDFKDGTFNNYFSSEACPECFAKADVISTLTVPAPQCCHYESSRAMTATNSSKELPKSCNVDDNLNSITTTPSEAETRSSFPENCECSNTTIKYEDCNHTVQNINRTEGYAKECAYKYGSEHLVPGACPDCSAHRRLKGNDKKSLHDPLASRLNADSSMQFEIEKVAKKLPDQELRTDSIHGGSTKKVEEANNELKTFIAALTLTAPIEAIFSEVEQGTTQAHEASWDLRAKQLFLDMETAARAGNDHEVATLKQSFLEEGENFKNVIKSKLEMAKEDVLKQCEAGVARMLEAFEETLPEDSFPSSPVV